jgi:hypothetical protein
MISLMCDGPTLISAKLLFGLTEAIIYFALIGCADFMICRSLDSFNFEYAF